MGAAVLCHDIIKAGAFCRGVLPGAFFMLSLDLKREKSYNTKVPVFEGKIVWRSTQEAEGAPLLRE
jgi:hypothetical protein